MLISWETVFGYSSFGQSSLISMDPGSQHSDGVVSNHTGNVEISQNE